MTYPIAELITTRTYLIWKLKFIYSGRYWIDLSKYLTPIAQINVVSEKKGNTQYISNTPRKVGVGGH